MKLSDIKIKKSFMNTIPREEKVNECREYWNKYHRQDRYIVVDNENTLIDGYIQYIVLEENDVDEAEVKISNKRKRRWFRKNVKDWNIPHYRNRTTTYIYGIHLNSQSMKERVWRVPDSWVGWENDLLPGDKILVTTKRGLAPIVITRIEWLNKCPVDMSFKKVVRKII